MAITANVVDGKLDYNYTDNSKKEVSNDLGYDQFLQLLCAEMQYQDPLEPTSNTDYVAQLATFSQLEATLSLESTQKNNFASTLVGQEVILAVPGTNGSTNYVSGTVDYVMYQNGETYLSVNDSLYPFEDLDTVTSAAYYEAVTMSKTFSSMVQTIPSEENLTYEYAGAIQQLRDFYDGMTEYQKGFVSEEDLKAFEKAESVVKPLAEAEEKKAVTLADALKEQVTKLPGEDALTVSDKDAVLEARQAYEALSTYQKTFVDESVLQTLETLEKKLTALEGA